MVERCLVLLWWWSKGAQLQPCDQSAQSMFAWAKNAHMFPTDLIWAQGSNGMGHLRRCPVGQQQEQADLSRGEAGMDLDSKGLRREGMSAGIGLSRRHLHGGNWDRGVWKNPNRFPPERLNFTLCRECDTSSQQCRPSRNFPAPILSLSAAPERRGYSPERALTTNGTFY